MSAEFLANIAKIRRVMPRNTEVMALCDELERRLRIPEAKAPKSAADDAPAALERLRATKRKAQKKWYHKDKERIKRIAEINQIKG